MILFYNTDLPHKVVITVFSCYYVVTGAVRGSLSHSISIPLPISNPSSSFVFYPFPLFFFFVTTPPLHPPSSVPLPVNPEPV